MIQNKIFSLNEVKKQRVLIIVQIFIIYKYIQKKTDGLNFIGKLFFYCMLFYSFFLEGFAVLK